MRKTVLTFAVLLVTGFVFAQKVEQVFESKVIEKTYAQPMFKGTNLEPLAEQLSVNSPSGKAWTTPYVFQQEASTYTEITGGTVHGTTANDDQNFNAVNIGFTFSYNGADYTQVSLNSNGFAALGATVSSSYLALSGGTSNNVLSPLNRDLNGQTGSELMTLLEGEAPNRIFTIQWKNYRSYSTTSTGDSYNFQIKLYETTNRIAFVYGAFTKTSAAQTVQVGIRGAAAADFSNRTTTTNWAATTPGTVNTASCALSTTILPVSGLKFLFREPFALDAQVTAIPAPIGNLVGNYDVIVTLKNSGTAEMTACDINWDINGTTGTYNWTGTLAANATENVTIITGHNFATEGANVISVTTALAGDENATNNTFAKTVYFQNPLVLPLAENFDGVTVPALPNYWARETTSVNWQTGTSGTIGSVSAPNFLALSYHSTLPKNDWAFTPYMALEAGKEYKLAFYVKAPGYSGTPEKMEVKIGTAQNSASMTDVVWDDANMLIAAWTLKEATITVAADGNYVLGFHGYSIADVNYIAIDDINITEIIPVDLGIFAITAPVSTFYAGAKDVIVTLKNFGSAEITAADIDWDIEGNTGTYNWTGTLAGGATADVTITNFDFATAGEYNISATTVFAGDANADNDAASKLVTVFDPIVAPFAEGFESTTFPTLPWEKSTSGTVGWVRSTAVAAQEGTAFAMFDCYNATAATTAKLTSPLVILPPAKGPILLTFYANYYLVSGTYGNTAGLYLDILDEANAVIVAGTVNLIAGQHGQGWKKQVVSLADYAGQNIKFSFRGVSDYGSYRIAVDAVEVYELLENDLKVLSVNVPTFINAANAEVAITANVENVGSVEQTKLVEFFANGNSLGTQEITLAAGASLPVVFNVTLPDADYYTIAAEVADDDNNLNNYAEKLAVFVTEEQLAENFAAATLPVNWSQTGGWAVEPTGLTAAFYIEGLGAFVGQVAGNPEAALVTPYVDINGWEVLSYHAKGVNNTVGYGSSTLQVKYRAYGEVDWTNIGDAINFVTSDDARLVSLDVSALVGGIYQFAFTTTSTFSYSTYKSYVVIDNVVADNIPFYNATVEVAPIASGLVNGEEFIDYSDTYIGTELVLTAVPSEGYIFENWTDGDANVLGTDAGLTYTVEADVAITANFREIVSATIDPAVGTVVYATPVDLTTVITWNDATMVSEVIAHWPNADQTLEAGVDYEVNDNGDGTADLTFFFSQLLSETKGMVDSEIEIFFDLGEAATYTLSIDLGASYLVMFNIVDEMAASINDAVVTVEGVSNSQGNYAFVLEPGTYNYSVEAAGYTTATGSFDVVDADVNVDVTLYIPTYSVTFNVVDEASAPITDAIVTFDGVEAAAGEYVFANIVAGDYDYTVAKEGYVSETGTANVIDGDLVIDITLVEVVIPTYTVTFNVVDEASAPITDAIVTFDGVEAAAGMYEFADLVAGDYNYTIAKDGFVTIEDVVTVVDMDLTIPVTMIHVGVNTNVLSSLNAYPNPFSNLITISNPSVVSRVVVANLIGQVVMDVRTNGVATVETAKLSAGVYLVTFEAANGENIVRKMVKK